MGPRATQFLRNLPSIVKPAALPYILSLSHSSNANYQALTRLNAS